MSFQGHGTDISRLAAADLRASQYRFVSINSAGRAALAVAGAPAVGVLQNEPDIDQGATIRVLGITKVAAGAAVAAGAQVTSDATSRAVAATLGRTNTSDAGAAADPLIGSNIIGIALEQAVAAGDIIAVLLTHSGAAPTTLA